MTTPNSTKEFLKSYTKYNLDYFQLNFSLVWPNQTRQSAQIQLLSFFVQSLYSIFYFVTDSLHTFSRHSLLEIGGLCLVSVRLKCYPDSGLWSSSPAMVTSSLWRERMPWRQEPSRRCCLAQDSFQKMRQMKWTSERFPLMFSRKFVCTSPTRSDSPTAPPRSQSSPSLQRLLLSSWWLQTSSTAKKILVE